ncbi:MAG: outer membrane lipoprotein-sorting protein [Proteobacteria bacterium]|nr:outer membrane lipoprotein-sorting protein [Pseudomonadota bacterium]
MMNLSLQQHQIALLILLAACLSVEESMASINSETSGVEIMEEVQKRHQQFPYIYEEQSMVMLDRQGDRDTRKARRFSRVEEDGSVKFLLLFDYPREVKGVALLANRDPDGQTSKYIYLPALGERLIESAGEGSNDSFLGTDFSVENLTGEMLSDHYYARRDDRDVDGIKYFVLDVYNEDDELEQQILRRHFIRQDNLYITLTHHFDKQGRITRIQSHHDLKAVDGDMWRANMILMEDKRQEHQSLIKISRRVFSHDYVPEEVFTAEWLYENYPYIETLEESDAVINEVESLEEVSDEMIEESI